MPAARRRTLGLAGGTGPVIPSGNATFRQTSVTMALIGQCKRHLNAFRFAGRPVWPAIVGAAGKNPRLPPLSQVGRSAMYRAIKPYSQGVVELRPTLVAPRGREDPPRSGRQSVHPGAGAGCPDIEPGCDRERVGGVVVWNDVLVVENIPHHRPSDGPRLDRVGKAYGQVPSMRATSKASGFRRQAGKSQAYLIGTHSLHADRSTHRGEP